MNLSQFLSLVAAVGLLVCTSCQSSKIAYGNSYYFKATPRPTQPAPELYTSTAPQSVPVPSVAQPAPSATVMPAPASVRSNQTSTVTQKEVRQTRRARRKATRTHLKRWLKEAPASVKEEVKEQMKQRVEGFTKVGIIVGAAGLVMLLVSLLGSNGFLVGIGGILLGIGVVFILIDLL